jgi:hypothetical protein
MLIYWAELPTLRHGRSGGQRDQAKCRMWQDHSARVDEPRFLPVAGRGPGCRPGGMRARADPAARLLGGGILRVTRSPSTPGSLSTVGAPLEPLLAGLASRIDGPLELKSIAAVDPLLGRQHSRNTTFDDDPSELWMSDQPCRTNCSTTLPAATRCSKARIGLDHARARTSASAQYLRSGCGSNLRCRQPGLCGKVASLPQKPFEVVGNQAVIAT